MIELDTQDPRVTAELNAMTRMLATCMFCRPFTYRTVGMLHDMVDERRAAFKVRYGAEFPPLVAFILPSQPFVVFYRADLSDEAIRKKLIMLLRQFGAKGVHLSAVEVAAALHHAWPHYKPPIEELRKDPKLVQVLQ